ncbi:ABC transporter permease [Croceitalea rosinachiae]|uniref:FtsX-like permease family protein n=1 Tax=Croceitalea rosinachiae TaxID=3075596 RepID=A0ABU3A902_9FLAO|nr:ABC transporter permease [Croceitalea sp. F388]MDT0606360.1 FtsX-like permease family protein [Croceitalea sp. F388]
MFKNNIKIAWRSLKKQPFFTFLNTFGLAIGMAGALLITLYIHDELSYDRMFADADRIYRINADVKFGGLPEQLGESPEPMAETLMRDYPQVELATRLRNQGSILLRKANVTANVKELNSTFADSTFFKMFGIQLLDGDAKTALKDPNTLVLTRTAAEKHFGINNAVGQEMVLNNLGTFRVTGVMEDMPKNSLLRDHTVFMSMPSFQYAQIGHWGSLNYYTFVKMVPRADMAAFQEGLNSLIGRYLIPWIQDFYPGMTEESFKASGNFINYSAMPLTDIHLYSNMKSELSANGSIQNTYILSFVALFLVILAVVNFMNLSTAYSMKRAKEVGVRKTLGSNKSDLVRQFLTESGLICFLSLLIAVGIAFLALPFFNELANKAISIPFANPVFWLAIVLATILLGLLSGTYPAFFMSRFIPVKVLKGSGLSNLGGSKVRNSLVVFQFAVSILLIVATVVVYQQLSFIQSKELGYDKEQILVLEDINNVNGQEQALKSEILRLGQVQHVTLSSFLPTPSARTGQTFFKEGANNQEDAINMEHWRVDHDYLSTIGLELVAGRDFDVRIPTDSSAIIINETTLRTLNVSAENAIGLRISSDLGASEEDITYQTIIGVVQNFHYDSMRNNIESLCLAIGRFPGSMAIKMTAQNTASTVSAIEGIWNDIAPGQPFNYYFMDDSFNNSFESEQRLGQIFSIFTVLSILIACLGLFGLATFNAQKRTKEIGIRKVLGASVSQISYRLTTDFLKMVGWAIIISLPIGWYAMNKWLEDFSYRIEIQWWMLLLAAFLAIFIAVVTVSYQSIKAAIVNPVKSLRTE